MRAKFNSMLGVWARSLVSIMYRNWKEVPTEVKDKLWACVTAKFDVGEDRKRYIMMKFKKMWKTFKYRVTTYVKKHLNEPELLMHPPTGRKWGSIPQEQWDEFVQYRKSKEFEIYRQSQTERRNILTINQTLSRKGYAGLKEEIQQETGNYDLVPREDLWIRRRQTKDGEFKSENVKAAAEKIKQVNSGEISFESSEDILNKALEKPEHPGRVLGAGEGVTKTSYSGRVKRKSSTMNIDDIVAEKVEIMISKRMKELRDELIKEMSSNFQPPHPQSHPQSDKNSCSKQVESQDQNMPIEKLSKNNRCKLVLDNHRNIVAYGMVFADDSISTVHGTPLASTDVRVSIDIVIQQNAILPRPVRDELILVKQAVGSIVAWPKQFVITNDSEVSKIESHDVLIPEMPPIVKIVFTFVKNIMQTGRSIFIHLDPEMFASSTDIMHIDKEDIEQFSRMDQISVSVIKVYMRLLFDKLKKESLHKKYRFADPEIFSVESTHNYEEKVKILGALMESIEPKQHMIFPYCELEHWMLVVVDPHEGQCYFFDSIGKDPRQRLKEFVNCVVRMSNHTRGRNGRKTYSWKTIKFGRKNSYTQLEIDEVRCEWAEYVWKLAATYVV